MATLFAPHYHTILDSTGNPVSGGTVRFFASGTTTPVSVYTDAAQVTAHTNPVVADSAGRLPAIYLDNAQAYRVREFDASGALIRDTDPLTINGADNIAFTQAGASASSRTVQDKMREFVSVTDFYQSTDPDDSLSFSRAFAAGKRVYAPAGQGHGPSGKYYVENVVPPSDAYLFGDGKDATIIKMASVKERAILNANSGSAGATIDNLTFCDVGFEGWVVEDGFFEQSHLLCLSGTRNAVIERCAFKAFQGDGIYVGSGDVGTDERHNYDTTIRDCVFDGVSNDNRQGISVIDGVGGTISGCLFIRCTRSNMPGPIDFEPNTNAHHIIKGWVVENNRFEDCGGNLAQIGMLIPTVVPLPVGIVIRNNRFADYAGTGADIAIDCRRVITSTDPAMKVLIDCNTGDGGNRPIDLYACKNVVVTPSNSFEDYAESALAGFTGATDRAWDVSFDGTYTLVGTNSGAVGLRMSKTQNLVVSGVYDRCGHASPTGYALQFNSSADSESTTLRNIRIVPNTSQTVAINDAGHTFTTPTNNRMRNVDLGGLTNQFSFRSELRASLTYLNSWTDAGQTRVERGGEGRVSLNLDLTGGTQTLNTQVGALPVGYRPNAQIFGVFQSGTSYAGLRVDTDGAIFITPSAAPGTNLRGFLSFSTGQ